MSIKYLTGKIEWHKNKELDKYGKRTLDLYMDEDQWSKFNSFELKTKARDNQKTGEQFVTLSRKKTGYGAEGATFELGEWEVKDAEGNPYNGEVWNGSDVTIKLEVYFSKVAGSNVARVEAVRVDKLAEAPKGARQDEQIERPF